MEEGFDCGKIVLIPLAAAENEETNWKCVLPDKAAGGDMILPGWRWKVSANQQFYSNTTLIKIGL